MDIDRFFTQGPGVPFRANDVFTDREQYISAYQERVLVHSGRSRDVSELMNFQRPARNVMAIIGEGGIGKSTVARHVARLSVEGEIDELPDNRAAAMIDFADVSSLSFETMVLRVRAALGGLGRSWPAFDIALALYWERKHPGESLVTFLRRSSAAGGAMKTSRTSEQITATVDEVLGGFAVMSLGMRLASLARQGTARSAALTADPAGTAGVRVAGGRARPGPDPGVSARAPRV